MSPQVIVIAKEPRPGLVKTRLCPPCTPAQAAQVCAAALDDTIDVVGSVPASGRVLLIDGHYAVPPGWLTIPQRGRGLAGRLANGFANAASGGPTLLIGMDTPQLTRDVLAAAGESLATTDMVLGLAADGGWWCLGLRDSSHAAALRTVRTSTPHTGARTLAALHARELTITLLRTLRDVDTAADALAVAAECDPRSRFARAVADHVPSLVGADR